jgi:hypothetical protein
MRGNYLGGRVEVTDCPRIIAGRAHGACKANSKHEKEAMSAHIVGVEILPNAFDPFPDPFPILFLDLQLQRF